jgi:hypothetical protein
MIVRAGFHRAARGEEARVDGVQIVDVVPSAVAVERGRIGSSPKRGAVLVRDAGKWNARRG